MPHALLTVLQAIVYRKNILVGIRIKLGALSIAGEHTHTAVGERQHTQASLLAVGGEELTHSGHHRAVDALAH